MCRLLGVVSSETTDYRFSLREAPQSLAALSPEHPHGWGLAVHDEEDGWDLHRHPACARDDARFETLAARARGKVLLAHIRKATVGGSSLSNTHPFRRGRWVFAHNGTIGDVAYLERGTSDRRRREVEGDTDSERFFAFLLTALDEVGGGDGTEHAADGAVDGVLGRVLGPALARTSFGAANFLLSDGAVLFAHRFGRTLHLLERGAGDQVRVERESAETEAVLGTPWGVRRLAVLVASERMTDEPWRELGERALIRIDGGARPRWTALGGSR
jgi:glutamine amidotransferase